MNNEAFVEIRYGMKNLDEHRLTIHEKDWLASGLSVFEALTARYLLVEMWQGTRVIRGYDNT